MFKHFNIIFSSSYMSYMVVLRNISIKSRENASFFIIVDKKQIDGHKNVILIKAITFEWSRLMGN